MTKPAAAIIIPTCNKAAYLPYTLESFLGQTSRDFRLIIVDDGSTDGTPAAVRAYRDLLPVEYLATPNQGRAAARNAGLARVGAETVIFNDDDRIVAPDFVERHLSAHRQARDPAVVIGWKRRIVTIWKEGKLPISDELRMEFAARLFRRTGRRLEDGPLLLPSLVRERFEEAVESASLGDDIDNYEHVLGKHGPDLEGFRLPWAVAMTANMSVSAEAVRAAGGFDPGFTGWGMEDTDLCYRLWKAGGRFKWETAAVNYHQLHELGPGSLEAAKAKRSEELQNNLAYFCDKHDTLEAFVFWRRWKGKYNIVHANLVLQQLEKSGPQALDEVKSLLRESLGRRRDLEG